MREIEKFAMLGFVMLVAFLFIVITPVMARLRKVFRINRIGKKDLTAEYGRIDRAITVVECATDCEIVELAKYLLKNHELVAISPAKAKGIIPYYDTFGRLDRQHRKSLEEFVLFNYDLWTALLSDNNMICMALEENK